MEEELRERLGEKYPRLEKFLENKKLDITKIYEIKPQERIYLVAEFCEQNNYDFPEIYSCFEAIRDKTMKENALRSAVAAILARDGPAAISDLNFYKKIQEKVKELEQKVK